MGIVKNFIQPLLKGNLTRVLSQQGPIASGNTLNIPILVDSTISQLIISTSISINPSTQLIRPNGSPITSSDSDVQITNFSSGSYIVVQNPTSGTWTTSIKGNGTYSIVADANSLIGFDNFKFVQKNTDMHGGFYPVFGQPQQNTISLGDAKLLGGFTNANFSLIDSNGFKISDLTLSQNFPMASPRDFVGNVNVPSVPFRIRASGTDLNGYSFIREFSTVFQPQLIGVVVNGGTSLSAPVGKTTSYQFTVTNNGPSASFNVTAKDTLNYLSGLSTSGFTLAQGQSQPVMVNLTVPSNAQSGLLDSLTLTATNTTDVNVFDSAQLVVTTVPFGETAGKPNFTASVSGYNTVSNGIYTIDVVFTNSGPGTAQAVSLKNFVFKTLTGTGSVTYNSSLSPALPIVNQNINPGDSYVITLNVNVPNTVKRFSIIENGTALDIDGVPYRFSQSQAIIKN